MLGFMELPPEAIKDAEGVGRFSQVRVSCALFRRIFYSARVFIYITGFLCFGLSRSEWYESIFDFIIRFVVSRSVLMWTVVCSGTGHCRPIFG